MIRFFDDPYTVLPGPKSRGRSEIPATSVPIYDVGQLLRDESSVCAQHPRGIPGPDVRRDPMRVSREQHEDPRLGPVKGGSEAGARGKSSSTLKRAAPAAVEQSWFSGCIPWYESECTSGREQRVCGRRRRGGGAKCAFAGYSGWDRQRTG